MPRRKPEPHTYAVESLPSGGYGVIETKHPSGYRFHRGWTFAYQMSAEIALQMILADDFDGNFFVVHPAIKRIEDIHCDNSSATLLEAIKSFNDTVTQTALNYVIFDRLYEYLKGGAE
jgi:hypothetical protein